jgi:hypothetical protein
LGSASETVNGGSGDDTYIETAATSGASINGGTGQNTLVLVGGGTFNLTTPATLANINTIDAREGGGSAGQTIVLRSGLNTTVNVASTASLKSGLIISGLTVSDYIDFTNISFVGASEVTFKASAAGGSLSVNDGVHTAQVALLGQFMSSTFTASSDGHGGTLVVDPVGMSGATQLLAASSHG